MRLDVVGKIPAEWSRERVVEAIRALQNQLNALSEGSGAAYHGALSAAPTAGTWARGDWVKNSAPSAGGTFGWVCVTAGTPGTWKAFGTIAP